MATLIEDNEKNRSVDDLITDDDLLLKYGDFCWAPRHAAQGYYLDGPICKQCLSPIDPFWDDDPFIGDKHCNYNCTTCGKKVSSEFGPDSLREIAGRAFQARINSKKQILSLDNPVSSLYDKVQDDFHVVKAYLSQKNGRKTALVYIMEKEGKGKKVQMFLDIENEQIRFHAEDLPPMKMLAKMKVEFKDSVHETTYKPEK